MIRFLLVLLIALIPAFSSASDYTYRDGLYWKNGIGYQRQRVSYSYKNCGRCYRSYRYEYTPVYQQKNETTNNYYEADKHWRDILADYVSKAKLEETEHQSYMESLQALGLASGGYAAVYQGYEPAYARQGATVYGYSDVASVYSKYDVSLGMNQAARLAESSQRLAEVTVPQFYGLLERIRADDVDLAEAVIAREIVQALTESVQTLRAKSPVTPGLAFVPVPKPSPQPSDKNPDGSDLDLPKLELTDNWKSSVTEAANNVLQSRCAACHGGGKASGDFEIEKFWSYDHDFRKEVLHTVTHHDPQKRMPLAADGGPGAPLSAKEKLVFAAALCLE